MPRGPGRPRREPETRPETETTAPKEAVTVAKKPEPKMIGMRVIGTPQTYVIGGMIGVWSGHPQSFGSARVVDIVETANGGIVKYEKGVEEHFVCGVSFLYGPPETKAENPGLGK